MKSWADEMSEIATKSAKYKAEKEKAASKVNRSKLPKLSKLVTWIAENVDHGQACFHAAYGVIFGHKSELFSQIQADRSDRRDNSFNKKCTQMPRFNENWTLKTWSGNLRFSGSFVLTGAKRAEFLSIDDADLWLIESRLKHKFSANWSSSPSSGFLKYLKSCCETWKWDLCKAFCFQRESFQGRPKQNQAERGRECSRTCFWS